MNRSDPIETCTVDFGTSIDRSGKVWVRFVFHEPDGTERAYAYDADAADAMIGPLTTAIQVARSTNPKQLSRLEHGRQRAQLLHDLVER